MTSEEYKQILMRNDVLDYTTLNITVKELTAKKDFKLAEEIQRILRDNKIEKPALHDKLDEASTNYLKILYLYSRISSMSKEEIKYEISKVLDHFSDKALSELLSFLKELDSKHESKISTIASLEKIFTEDKDLLVKLAQ